MKNIITLLTLLIACSANAAEIVTTVTYGDNISVFKLKSDKNKHHLDFKSTIRKADSTSLTQKDYDTLMKTLAPLAQDQSKPDELKACPRKYIKMKEHFACMPSSTTKGKILNRFVAQLALLIQR
jgi:hypothetical protein